MKIPVFTQNFENTHSFLCLGVIFFFRSYLLKIHLPKFKKNKLAFQQTDTQDGKKRCNVIFIFTLQFCHCRANMIIVENQVSEA